MRAPASLKTGGKLIFICGKVFPVLKRSSGSILLMAGINAGFSALGQTPQISGIVNGATFTSDYARGGLVTIFGTNLSDQPYAASGIPLPTVLGATSVQVCTGSQCFAASLYYASPSQINLVAPSPLIVFDAVFTVKVIRAGISSAATPFTAALVAPEIVGIGFDCPIDTSMPGAGVKCGLSATSQATGALPRGAIIDQSGRVVSSANPARVNTWYSLFATGLENPNTSDTGMGMDYIPLYKPYLGGTTSNSLLVGYAGSSAQFPGLDQVNFQLPSAIAGTAPNGYPPYWPCGNYNWEILLTLSESLYSSSSVWIPVVIKNGDVMCISP